jgi:hypothetical protein
MGTRTAGHRDIVLLNGLAQTYGLALLSLNYILGCIHRTLDLDADRLCPQ